MHKPRWKVPDKRNRKFKGWEMGSKRKNCWGGGCLRSIRKVRVARIPWAEGNSAKRRLEEQPGPT